MEDLVPEDDEELLGEEVSSTTDEIMANILTQCVRRSNATLSRDSSSEIFVDPCPGNGEVFLSLSKDNPVNSLVAILIRLV